MEPESDKARRQRDLDRLAFNVLAGRYTGPNSWMTSMTWLELTKAQRGERGLGHTTFANCIRRLLDQGKVKRSQIAKNRFYQAIFVPGNSLGIENDCQESSVVPDVAAQALEQLNRKSPGVI
jgi:hypothetical protein